MPDAGSPLQRPRTALRLASSLAPRNVRSIALWLVASIAIHGLLFLALALLLGPGVRNGEVVPHVALTAALTPVRESALPEPQAAPRPPADPRVPLPAETAIVPLPVPIKPDPRLREMNRSGGQVTINPIDDSEPVDPAMAALLRQFHPGAQRAAPEFDVPPSAVYPKAALAEQRNVHLRVLVIMHPDGRVELAKGGAHDPVFLPSIRAALTTARARPADEQERPPLAWAVLLFIYEFVGVN